MKDEKTEALINHILEECEKQELTIEDVRTLPNKLKSSIDRKIKIQNSFTCFQTSINRDQVVQ